MISIVTTPTRLVSWVLASSLSLTACEAPNGPSGAPSESEDEDDPVEPPVRTKPPARADAAPVAMSPDARADGNPAADAVAATDGGGDSTGAAPDADEPPSVAGTAPQASKGTWGGKCHSTATLQNGEIVPRAVGPHKLVIGAGSDGRQRLPWDLDMVRLYDRPPTLEMIKAHYEKKAYEPCTKAYGCLAEYDFEEVTADTARDTGPHAFPTRVGRKESGARLEQVPGVRGKAGRFGPVWLEVEHHDAMNAFKRSFAFEAWMRRNYNSSVASECPVDGRDGNTSPCRFMRLVDKGTNPTFRLDMHAGGVRFEVKAETPGARLGIMHAGNYNAFKPGEWFHYVVILDSRAGFITFENGRQVVACFP